MDAVLDAIFTAVGYLKFVTISDVLDVGIVAFLIYHGLMMVRQSSAVQIAKAVIFILVALALSYTFKLNVINFILGKAVEAGFIALVIIFQPEIRRFLEQLGSNNMGMFLTRDVPSDELETAITQTVTACNEMSQTRTGALIVFERANLLDSIIASGTVLDASVSSELLKNIFYPKAPLHDGAVIIRGGRLAGAGCMLPLSGNLNLSRDLGMRHRAGIGMSEHSDAVVAIVSEETGSISVAINGRLKRHLAPDTLERLLRNELLPESRSAKKSPWEAIALFFKKKGGET